MVNVIIALKEKVTAAVFDRTVTAIPWSKPFRHEVGLIFIASEGKVVTGEFKPGPGYKELKTPRELWELGGPRTGLNRGEFMEYFKGESGCLILINEPEKYVSPQRTSRFGVGKQIKEAFFVNIKCAACKHIFTQSEMNGSLTRCTGCSKGNSKL